MTIQEKLIGTSWELETYQSEDKFGNINYPLGENAKGYIIFTDENRLAVQIMAENREKKRAKGILNTFNTEAEKGMAELGYHAYSGLFNIDEEKAHLITHVDVSLLTSYVGSDQVRAVKINGNTLYLSNVKHPERKLVWKKTKSV